MNYTMSNREGRTIGFVPIDSTPISPEPTRMAKFKYKYRAVYTNIRLKLLDGKRVFKTLVDKLRKYLILVEYKALIRDSVSWLFEAMIEGLLANFATYQLFNLKFTVATTLAYGIVIKKVTELLLELRQSKEVNAASTKVSKDAGTRQS